jgi:glycine dehydrogenase subunit 2
MAALECLLAEITGMDAVTLQPGAGAQGELAGMLIFHAHHRQQGRPRSKIIVPDTAHGTNPASAALCGYHAVPVASNERGVLSPEAVAAVMAVLRSHVSPGEMEDVERAFTEEVRALFG